MCKTACKTNLSNPQVIMKGVVLILSAIAAVSTAVQCPTDASHGQEVDLILQHEDCNRFYKCIRGEAFEQACSTGLFYNPANTQCDHAEKVVCGTRNVPQDENEPIGNRLWWIIPGWPWPRPPKPTPKPEEEEEPKFLENGCPEDPHTHWLLPSEDDCKQFYSCVWGEKVGQKCPGILSFNPTLQVCDWPWRAGCTVEAANSQ